MRKVLLLSGFLFLLMGAAFSQGSIAGLVKDATTGESIIGANVILKGTQTGASTDQIVTVDANGVLKKVGYEAVFDLSPEEKNLEKQKELKTLKIKVIIGIVISTILIWGSFPGVVNSAPAIIQNYYFQGSSLLKLFYKKLNQRLIFQRF